MRGGEGRCALALFVSQVHGILGGLNHWGSCSAPIVNIFFSLSPSFFCKAKIKSREPDNHISGQPVLAALQYVRY